MNNLLSSTYFGPVQWYQKLAHGGVSIIERHDHFIKQTFRNRCVIATTQGQQALTVPVESPQGLRIDKTEMKDVRISDHGAWRHLHWQALQSAYGESPFFEYYVDDILPFFEKKWEFLFDFNLDITYKMCELLDIEPHIELTEEYLDVSDYGSNVSECGTHVSECGTHVSDTIGRGGPCARPQPNGDAVVCGCGHNGCGRAQGPPLHDDTVACGCDTHACGCDTYACGCGDVIVDYRDAIRPKHPLPDASFVPRPYYQVYQQKFGFLPNLSILDLLFNEGNEAVLYL